MDKEFIYFIIGCIVIVPVLFLIDPPESGTKTG